MENDIYQFSPFPWVSYTHISHTESGKKDNATPLFDWENSMKKMEKSICLFPYKCIIHLLMAYILENLQCYLNSFE